AQGRLYEQAQLGSPGALVEGQMHERAAAGAGGGGAERSGRQFEVDGTIEQRVQMRGRHVEVEGAVDRPGDAIGVAARLVNAPGGKAGDDGDAAEPSPTP